MAGAVRVVRAVVAVLALLAVALGGGPVAPAPAAAVDTGRGRPGFCPDGNGVTVVVDFRELGGTTLVRCAVGSQATGLAALKAAGIEVTGTSRWGESFICRLENKPGPSSERCVDTPPSSAYWSYWHAPDGGRWTYSQYGATYRTPPKGSFEGWSFSTGRDEDDAPAPRLAPLRPSSSNGGSGDGGSGGSGTGGGSTGGGGGSVTGGSGGTGPGGADGGTGGGDGAVGGPGGNDTSATGGDGGPEGTGKGADGGADGDRDGKKGPGAGPSGADDRAGGAPSPVVTPTEAEDWTGGEDRTAGAAEEHGDPAGTVFWASAAAVLALVSGALSWHRRRAERANPAAGGPGSGGAGGGPGAGSAAP
ncbi:hypothetical protein [Streptomyces sp. Z26]|uniref:hypothetical protein n=1 Tax=Streptomyces sp. Z26 TaxID=2500177 RepID=UPI0019D26488|nr:hypothetical protein [Streptomyces sp. Z26]